VERQLHQQHGSSWPDLLDALRKDVPLAALMHGTLPRLREVLNIVHKSQVMLVEKDANNESSAWRLDSVDGIRSDDNFYAKYMAGAYGAVPQL
jgi:hypothetical protein